MKKKKGHGFEREQGLYMGQLGRRKGKAKRWNSIIISERKEMAKICIIEVVNGLNSFDYELDANQRFAEIPSSYSNVLDVSEQAERLLDQDITIFFCITFPSTRSPSGLPFTLWWPVLHCHLRRVSSGSWRASYPSNVLLPSSHPLTTTFLRA